jgi:hypothetical protein
MAQAGMQRNGAADGNTGERERFAPTPRDFSRASNTSILFCEARTPASSSRRMAASMMSYQARIT